MPFSIVTKISLFYFYMPWHFCGSAYIESWNLYRSMPHRAALLGGLWDLTKAFLFSFYLTLHVASDPMWDWVIKGHELYSHFFVSFFQKSQEYYIKFVDRCIIDILKIDILQHLLSGKGDITKLCFFLCWLIKQRQQCSLDSFS